MNYASVAFESLLRLDRTGEREAPRYKCSRKLEVVARVTMGKIFCLVCTVLLDIRANGTQLLGWLELGFNAAGNWFFSPYGIILILGDFCCQHAGGGP